MVLIFTVSTFFVVFELMFTFHKLLNLISSSRHTDSTDSSVFLSPSILIIHFFLAGPLFGIQCSTLVCPFVGVTYDFSLTSLKVLSMSCWYIL